MTLLWGLATFHGFSQTKPFQYLDVNTLQKDRKIAVIKSLLPKGWEMKTNGEQFFIERNQPVLVTQNAIKSVDKHAATIKHKMAGKDVLMIRTKAFFRFTVEKKWNENALKNIGKTSALRVFNSDYFTFFLWDKHAFSYTGITNPAELKEEFLEIERLLNDNLDILK
ncbi:hypothetical protein [Pseudarcicella hirudinis]|uniref:hypothetical protein n=1 Tax=Pseudarcicella hirudinis TaxID=1079859 RepID=UPI0011601AC0|nr:hypothetical protein [Pseudarcicella hirudinis]